MARKEPEQAKYGAGHAAAMWRQGLRELRQAVYPESNIANSVEQGVYGTKTPGEIADDRRMVDRDFDEEPGSDELVRGRDVERDEYDDIDMDFDD